MKQSVVKTETPLIPRPFGDLRASAAESDSGYTDLQLLGSGGNGSVYSAVHAATGERRALKFIERSGGDEFLFPLDCLTGAAGLTEATAMLRLAGVASVPCLKEVFHTPDQFVISMDILDSGHVNLEDLTDSLLADGLRLTEDGALRIFGNIVAVLAECRERGSLFHSDVKGDNIMLNTTDLKITMIDFGAAKPLYENPAKTYFVDLYNSTEIFSPPEYNSRRPYSADSLEAYSLGVVLYRLLHPGKFPYAEQPIRLEDLENSDAWPVLELRDGISDNVRRLLEAMLMLKAEYRIKFDG